MHASAADHSHSHIQGEQGSASRSSMWPVLMLGILSAIIAWVWYRGSGEENQAESPVQKPDQVLDPTLPPGGAQESEESKPHPQVASRESKLHAADPEGCEQDVPCPGIQEKKVLSPEVYQTRCEQQPKLQVQELSDGEHLKSGSKGPSHAAATTVPLKVQEEAGVTDQTSDVPAKGELQEQENHEPKVKGLHGNIKEHLPDLQREDEAQANLQEHLPDLQGEDEAQANLQEHLPDLQREDEAQANLQEHLPDLQGEEEAQANLQEHLPDLLGEEEAQAYLQEHLPDLQGEEEAQANLQEHLPDLLGEEEAQAYLQEHLPDLQGEEEAQANLQEHLPDLLGEEEAQAYLQEHLIEKEDEPVEHQTRVPEIQDSLLEEHLEDVVHTNLEEPYKEFSDKNGSHEGDMRPSHIPEERGFLSNGDEVYPPLKKEVAEEQYPQDLDKAMVQANEPGAQILLDHSCHASKSEQENGQGEECQEGVYANGGVDGAEPAAGCLLEHVKENAVNVLEAKKTQDGHLEGIHTSGDEGNTTVADLFMTHEPVERFDLSTEKASPALEDNAEVCACASSESSQEGLLHFQNFGTGPETSSVNVFNFISKQEKNLSGPGNIEEKTSVGCSSEENIHDLDHQKARKVATIQPMPQNVDFALRVHYITHSDAQIVAVTGDHEKLGNWEAYVPLTSGTGGFWTHSISLPADTTLAWKFVMVENGKIKRWEECHNRFLKMAHEDLEARLYWGYP